MADQSEKTPPAQPLTRGGWHAPVSGNWRDVPKPQPEADSNVTALPAEMPGTPERRGSWHLPASADTPFTPGQQVILRDGEVVLPEGPRPEDLIAEILAQSRKSEAAPPEEFDFPADEADDSVLPEEYELEQRSTIAPVLTPDLGTGAVETTDDLDEALDELEDADDDEAFKVSELAALASISEGTQATTSADLAGLHPDDLSPAQKAMFNAAQEAEEIMPAAQQPVGDDAASVARRMAELYASGEAADLPAPASTPAGEQGETAADIARRMALELAGGTVSPPTQQQQISPADAELAQKFIDTRNQVNTLRGMYNAGQITYEDLQNRLRALTILDNSQVWWMLGIESDKWYRYDNATGQWVEATPPVPLTEPSGMSDVVPGSMPYFPDEVSSGGEYSDPYATAGMSPTAGMPVPRPGQPVVDTGATIVGSAYDADYLPGEATIRSSGGLENTLPSQSTIPSASQYEEQPIESPYGQEYPPEYDVDEPYTPTFDELKEQERASLMRYVVIGVIVLVSCGIVTAIGSALGVMAWYNGEVAQYEAQIAGLANYNPPFQTARILDARGQLIAELNSQQGGAREVVRLEDVSPYLLHAIIATENETFYEDPGFSFPAITRAFLQNLSSGEIESGASTITQQIARNLILQDTDVTAGRKVQEILVANRIAETYDKNFILALYVNQFFFGNQSYGVEAASQFYFDKPAKEVNMAEAAMLTSLIQSPAGNDPVVNREQSKIATRNVIRRMLEVGCLTFQHGEWAEGGSQEEQPFCIIATERGGANPGTTVDGEPLVIVNDDDSYSGVLVVQLARVETRPYLPRQSRYKYPHYVNFIQSLVEAQFGPDAMFSRGFTIYTTLEPRIQDAAQDALAQQVAALVNNGVNTGAVMVTDPQSGAIRAMVGSPDFNNERFAGQVDNTRTFQQPGSSIKPVVYATALEMSPTGQYLTPASILWDVQSTYNIPGQQPYTPVNFDRRFRGPVTLRYALQNSLNVPAVKAFEYIGAERFKEMATRLGLNYVDGSIFTLPSALGANDVRLIDMMKVYGTIANNGVYAPLYAIERITEDVAGSPIDVPLAPRGDAAQKLTPQLAYLLQNILTDDTTRRDQFGINSDLTLARLGIPTQNYVGAKSGTSDGNRDLWTMGFTSNTVTGVWVGTFDNSTTSANSLGASRIWNLVMEAAIAGRAPQPFANPGGVMQGTVCRDTGTLDDPNGTCPTRITDIWIQQQPPPPPGQGLVQVLSVDSWTNLLANEWCSENQVQSTFAAITDPFAVQWLNTTGEGQAFKARLGLPADLPAPPAQACTQGMVQPSIRLNAPFNGQTITGTINVEAQISAPDLSRFEVLVAPSGSPNQFSPVVQATNQQFPTSSVVGTWNTTTFPNGSYIVRLAAYSTAGGYIFRDVTVTLNNIPPTPTAAPPTFTPVPLPPTQPVFTPLPFPTDSGPTPTLGGI